MIDREMERLIVELAEFKRSRRFGKYMGLVKDVDDPKNLGRIRAQVPEVMGEEVLPWAMPSIPLAGDNHWFFVLPEVKDGVWIEFEGGDTSRPIWSGCFFGESDKRPGAVDRKKRMLLTKEGLKVVLDDNKKKIEMLHPGGGEISISDSEILLKLGSSKISLTKQGVKINDMALEVR